MCSYSFSNLPQAKEDQGTNEPWVAALAHELREPLNSVVLSLGLAEPACAADSEVRGAIGAARRAIEHMGRVIDDVLALRRCVLRKQPIRTERIEVNDVVASALDLLRPNLSTDGRRLIVSLLSTPVFVDAHPVYLRQVLTNLLANAIKHTEPHGTIALSCELNGLACIVRVRDDGAGMSRELLPHVFDLYRQGDGTTAGLGIGLALVKQLVELHGGRVEAHSPGPGRGTEFTVSLPTACQTALITNQAEDQSARIEGDL